MKRAEREAHGTLKKAFVRRFSRFTSPKVAVQTLSFMRGYLPCTTGRANNARMATKQIAAPKEEHGKAQHAPLMGESTIAVEYFKPEELATMLGRDKRTLERWEAQRIGPPRTVIGKLVLYRKTAVMEWLRSREENHNRPSRRAR
jgi:hypothetical protein